MIAADFLCSHYLRRTARRTWETKTKRKNNTMKTMLKLLVLGLSLGATTLLMAQDGPPPREGGGPGMGGHRPPPPIIGVLDANHDGVIDAEEIANASAALKQLDKNGDGELTPDELHPPRPEHGQPGEGPRGGLRPAGPPPERP